MSSSIESFVVSLFESLNDKDDNVREAVLSSLHTIGVNEPCVFLNAGHLFLATRHAKLSNTHRSSLLNSMKKVCAETVQTIPDNLAALIINLAIQELVFSKEIVEEWQSAASGLLTVLCRKHCSSVVEGLLQKFQPGIPPHPYIIITLGDIAITNAIGFVPFLPDILSRAVPMLNTTKQDVLRYAYVTATKKFCESVLEYASVVSQSGDDILSRENFATQFGAVYDVFHTSWVQTKEIKTKAAIFECLGELCHLINQEKMREETKRLFPQMISQLKKLADPLPVITGVCRLLEAAISEQQIVTLDSSVDDLWAVLFNHVAVDPDRVDTNLVRCQNEALRCYHVTATRYSDKLVYYLIQKLQSMNEKTRISALIVLRHLINSSGIRAYVEDKKTLIIMALKNIINDTSNKVRKWLCHLTLALGDHGYLDIENGHLLVEFIVKQMSIVTEDEKRSNDPDYVTNKALRFQCGQALYCLSSNVRSSDTVLWPFLFEYICVESYTIALTDICKSLVSIAQRLNSDNRLNIVYLNASERLPGPHQILARLLVCLGVLDQKSKRGTYICQLLKEMANFFYPALKNLWQHEIIGLSDLYDNLQNLKQKNSKWQIALLKFVSKSLDCVMDEEWICALAAALGKQFNLYTEYLEEKKFLFKLLGTVLSKVKNLQFVVDHLDLIFKNVNHANPKERLGCAQGLGYCASVHTDIVLTKLENMAKLEFQRKSTGLLGFIKDNIPMKSENDTEIVNMKATIMLAYGYIALNCPVKQLVNKLETIVIRFLTPYFANPKDTVVRQSLLRTIDLIAISLHPSRISVEHKFNIGVDFFSYIKDYVKTEQGDSMTTNIRILAMNAVNSLSKLDIPINESELWNMITLFGHYVYPIQNCRSEVENDEEVSVSVALNTFNALQSVVLLKQSSAERLTVLLKILQPWFSAESPSERERSIESACELLKTYYTSADIVLGHATEFPLLGGMLGRFCPRFCDSVPGIRQKALDCVHWFLAISVAHMGHGKDYHDTVVDSILDFKENLEKPDTNAHLSVVVQLAKVIDQRLPGKQIQNYLTVLFDLLLDKQSTVSTAAANLLKIQLTTKGEHLVSEAEKIISVLLMRLPLIQNNSLQTYAESILALHEFSKHHLTLTLNALLNQQLSFSQSVCDCWASLSRDHQLLPLILSHLLELLTNESPFDIIEQVSSQKQARLTPLSATAALNLVCQHLPESSHQQWFSRLLVRLLIQCGSFSECALPRTSQISMEFHKQNTPATVVRDALKSLLSRHPISYSLDDRTWTDFEDSLYYPEAASQIAKSIGAHTPELIEPVVHLLKDCQTSKVDGSRVVCASILSSFVKFCQNQSDELIETVVATLMAGLVDSNLIVRKISVRGMGYITHCSDAIFERYIQTVLSAMMAGLEDPTDHKDEVALEAMQGLGRLTTRISKDKIEKNLTYIMLRIRPCFEKGSGAVRAVAFNLFANLARFDFREIYVEQIHSNVVSLFLHLYDDVEEVRSACAFVVTSMSLYMKNSESESSAYSKLVDLTEKYYLNKSTCLSTMDYNDYLKEATKFLTTFYPDRVNFYALCCANYLKSSSIRMRCNAAYFMGFLLGNVPQEQRTTISKDLIFTGLALLLKEPEPEVRLAAAEASAYLHGY